jgi:hypothetical protein
MKNISRYVGRHVKRYKQVGIYYFYINDVYFLLMKFLYEVHTIYILIKSM